MPAILRVVVHACRGLPVMDQRHKLADAYVELAWGKQPVRRTPVVRKSLNPVFDWHARIEVPDDEELLVEPVVFRVMDKVGRVCAWAPWKHEGATRAQPVL